jgi:hypothetical protein
MTTSIETIPTGGAVADPNLVIHAPIPGLEDYDGSEFRLPRIQVVQTGQQMTDWEAKGGQFHNSVTGENKDELDVVVLAVKQNRWYGPDFDETAKLKAAGHEVKAWCKSSNGKTPDADSEKLQAQVCKLCPHFKGARDAQGNYTPSPCSTIRKVLVAEPDGTVAMMMVRNAAAREVDTFTQPFFMRKVPTFTMRATIKTSMKKDTRNTWYVPSFKARPADAVSEEDQAELKDLLVLYAPLVNRVEESDGHGDGDEPAAGGGPSAGSIPVQADEVPEPSRSVDDLLNDPTNEF